MFVFIIFDLFVIDIKAKFSLRTFTAKSLFSIQVTILAPLDIHSMPNDPTPEYKSKTLEFSILILIFRMDQNIENIFFN